MGNIVTWLIGIPIILVGLYILMRTIKKGVKGEGCSGCPGGCSCDSEEGCNH